MTVHAGERAAVGPPDPLAPAGERVLLSARPSWAYFFACPPSLAAPILILAGGLLLAWRGIMSLSQAIAVACALVALCLLVLIPRYLVARYVLTERRMLVRWGVLRRVVRDLPLANIQHVVLRRSIRERILGAGTILAASAGTDTYALSWMCVARPHAILESLRSAIRSAGGEAGLTPGIRERPDDRFLVIGLVGGIGAGKSEAARILGETGFLVIDADRDAKAALELPEVREQLIAWWGSGILGPDGKVDRSKVAAIIFADPGQRRRLESIIHPLVRQNRARTIQDARRAGKVGVVIDAPLLFEAGSDAQCDVVLFVDAPREQRLDRVRRTKGWDESELARREAAQMPLDEKRRRAGAVVVNSGDPGELRDNVREALGQLRIVANPGLGQTF